MKFWKNNRLDGEHEKTPKQIIEDFKKSELAEMPAPFERLLLNFMASEYGSFDVITEQEWQDIYEAKRKYEQT